MFWCKVKAVHYISDHHGIENYETRDVFTLDQLAGLKNTWESSIARVYKTVESPYSNGAFIILEVQERGARGLVYEQPKRYVGLFDKIARDQMIVRPDDRVQGMGRSIRLAGVTASGAPMFETYAAGWSLGPKPLNVMCDTDTAGDELLVVKRANAAWNKAVAKTRRTA